MVEVIRNIQVKLNIPESRRSDVDQTFEEFRQAAQHVSDYGWNDGPDHLVKAKNKLHKATYTEVREQNNLQSSLVQSARNLAADALSNCKDLLEDDKRTSKPEFRGSVIVYNGRTITYNDASRFEICALSYCGTVARVISIRYRFLAHGVACLGMNVS